MEFAARGRSTAAVDGVGPGDGRRFSDPQPPHGRDAHSVPADMAALGFRREELLREFHRERIRLDMILCDLAETERAMTTCLAMPAAGWSAWCGRPSMHQCGETLYRAPWSSEETSWWRRNPSEPVTPPVYPYVERSPSPVLQQQPVDAEQQERGSSPRALAVAPSACPDAEQRWSLSKDSAVEALVQAAINAVNPMEPALLSEEVALETRDAVNQERGHELMESHGVQLTESGIQRSEEPKCPANGEKREAERKNSHAMQLMESELQRSEHPMHASDGQESEAEVKDCHPMQLMECEVRRSECIKRAAVGQGRGTKADTSHAVQVMENNFQISDQVKRGSVGQENKAEAKDNHGVLMESEIQRSEQPKLEASGQDHEAEEKDRHAQSKPAQPTINGCINELRELPHQYALAGKEKSLPKEQKRLVVNEPKTRITPSGVKERSILRINRQKPLEESSGIIGQVNLTCEEHLTQHQAGELHGSNLAVLQSTQGAAVLTAKSTPVSSHRLRVRPISHNGMVSEIQRSKQPKCSALGQERAAEVKNSHAVQLMEKEIQRSEQTRCEAFGEEQKAEEKDNHAVQLMKESGIQSREQPKPADPTFRGGIDEPHAPSVKEKLSSNEHKRLVFNEPKTQITPGGVKRRPVMRINRQKPLEESSCNLGLVNLTHEEDLTQHQAGELHRPNLAVLQSRQGAAGLTAKSTPESSHRACNDDMESEIQRSEQPKHSALGQGRESEVKNSHAVQLMENKMQRSQQTMREALGEEHKSEEKDSHAGQLMKESIIHSSEQPKPAEPIFRVGIVEHRQSPHALSVKEKSPSNEHKRLVFNEPKTQITPGGVKRRPIMRIINRQEPLEESSSNLGLVNLTREEDLTQHQAGELHRPNLTVLQSRQGAAGLTAKSMPESSHRACNDDMESEIQRSEQPKCSALGQEHESEATNSHAVQLMENKMQRSEQTMREALGEEHKAEEKDSHAGQLMKESIIRSSEQPKPAEPTFRDGIVEHRQSPHALSVKEKSPSNEHKRLVFNETKTQITPSGVKRPIVGPTVTTPPPKRHKQLGEWGCSLCQVNLTSEEDLTQHKAGELHRSNLATLRAKQEASGFDLRNHLRGRSHQESTPALRTEGGGNQEGKCAVDSRGDPKKKFMSNVRLPFCELCNVKYSSEKVMVSHLGGKKHRENLLARH